MISFLIASKLWYAIFFVLGLVVKKIGKAWFSKNFDKIVETKNKSIPAFGAMAFGLMLVLSTLTMPTVFNPNSIFTRDQSLIFIYISIFGIIFFTGVAIVMDYKNGGKL